MLKKWATVIVVVVSVFIASLAHAEDKYLFALADRPLTLNDGMMRVKFDYGLGLNDGRMAKDMWLNLGYAYGLTDNWELGTCIEAMDYSNGRSSALGFGGISIYGRYQFMEYLGLDLSVYFPGDRTYIDSFGDQLLGLNVALPAQYIIIKETLKLHGGLALDASFVKDSYPTSGGKSMQFDLLLDYGLTWNIIPEIFLDLSSGANFGMYPANGSFGDRVEIPLQLSAGGTLINGDLDLALAFRLDNLNPPAGGAIDSKSVWLNAAFRF